MQDVSDLMNAKSFREANIDFDHYLLISRIRSHISNERNNYGFKNEKFK